MTTTYRYWPRDKAIQNGWEHVPGALENTHHGRHAILLRQIYGQGRDDRFVTNRGGLTKGDASAGVLSSQDRAMTANLKRIAVAIGALALITMGILVATGHVKAAEKSPAWTGIYVGASVGYGATKSELGADVAGMGNLLAIDGLGTSGGSAGLKVGADLRVQQFLVGAFADWTHHDQEWSISSGLIPGGTLASLKLEDSWTIGGRAGVIVGNSLVYGLVGYTTLHTSDVEIPVVPAALAMSDLKGWTLGGGIDLALTDSIFLGAEYRFTQFDKQDWNLGGASLWMEPEMHEARASLTYKFGIDVK
jgi:outer membrane immunogenic protein